VNQVLVSIDIEMTSAKPEHQEILEIAVIKFKGHKVLDSWSTLVNPECEIPYGIERLTGIRQADVDRAPVFEDVAEHLSQFIGNLPLVAHTVSSDVGCLERKGLFLTNPQIDTFELASILLPHLSTYSLAALADHFKIPFHAHHRAAEDALVTKELFCMLMDKASELDLSIIQEINRLTALIDWPLGTLFRDIEKEKSMKAFDGTSIRSRLAAKSGLENATLDVMFASRPNRDNLVPNEYIEPIDAEELGTMLSPDGKIAQGLAGYEHRPQQVEMTQAVANAFNEGCNLIVEAGTGVGKSLAYLLPAIYFSARNNHHVVVSTNTINLQDQLFNKDIPGLQEVLPVKFRAALVKGRSNYLCQRRWVALRRHHELTRKELMTLVKIVVWLPSTSTGDVAELNLTEEERPVWAKMCAQAESCLGNQCLHFRKGSCFLFRARQNAAAANVIVVNHSLLLSDLASNSRILPEYHYLVVDEAHHFEDEATQQLGFSVSDRDVNKYFDDLSEISGHDRRAGLLVDLMTKLQLAKLTKGQTSEIDTVVGQIHDAVDRARVTTTEFFAVLSGFVQEHRKDNRGYETRLRLTGAMRAQPDWSKVELSWDNLSVQLGEIEEKLSKLLAAMGKFEGLEIPDFESSVAELSAALFMAQEFRSELNGAVTNPQAEQIYWLSAAASRGFLSVNGAPLHVGPILDKMLFSAKESVVLTSATLATAGTFDFVRERLGLNEAEELLLGSPYNYARSTLLYVPEDVPEPDRPEYQRQMQTALFELVKATDGRALVLFTSHNHLRQTYQAIKEPLAQRGILAVAHGVDGSARQLLQTFKTNPKTVLFGTSSFWEGVDVVGEALSVLVIARLPFAVPTDPIIAARSEQFEDAFSQYSVPQSILRFKQGFGRLIRSKSDRGVVVVLDRRVISRSYGRLFLRSLPDCTVRHGSSRMLPELAANWLRPTMARSGALPAGVRRGFGPPNNVQTPNIDQNGKSASENPK
jgi:DNA polymerase-3 subunit epsilon/ATP-dependent DNA helicase DinG